MRNRPCDETLAEEVMDEDWPPREPEVVEPSAMDQINSFITAVLDKSEDSNTFTCPICGHQAYRNVGRKCFAAKCEGCGMRLIS